MGERDRAGVCRLRAARDVRVALRDCSPGETDMTKPQRKWSGKVTTDSTHPPEGLFNKDAETVARTLASKKVSPKGPGSGRRMLSFYITRAGKNLSARR